MMTAGHMHKVGDVVPPWLRIHTVKISRKANTSAPEADRDLGQRDYLDVSALLPCAVVTPTGKPESLLAGLPIMAKLSHALTHRGDESLLLKSSWPEHLQEYREQVEYLWGARTAATVFSPPDKTGDEQETGDFSTFQTLAYLCWSELEPLLSEAAFAELRYQEYGFKITPCAHSIDLGVPWAFPDDPPTCTLRGERWVIRGGMALVVNEDGKQASVASPSAFRPLVAEAGAAALEGVFSKHTYLATEDITAKAQTALEMLDVHFRCVFSALLRRPEYAKQ